MCGDAEWVRGVFVVTAGCPSKANAAGGAVDIILWRNDIENLNDDELLSDIIWGDGEMFCEGEERDEFGDSNNGARAGRAGFGDEDVGVLWRFGRAKEK